MLPNSLEKLKFGGFDNGDFNESIDENVLPPTLKKLKFSKQFDQPIRKNVLPNSLQILEFGSFFDSSIYTLPPNLTKLQISNKYSHDLILPKLLILLDYISNKKYHLSAVTMN